MSKESIYNNEDISLENTFRLLTLDETNNSINNDDTVPISTLLSKYVKKRRSPIILPLNKPLFNNKINSNLNSNWRVKK